jgi:hypothetical protein
MTATHQDGSKPFEQTQTKAASPAHHDYPLTPLLFGGITRGHLRVMTSPAERAG